MLKTAIFAVAIGAMTLLFAIGANALPPTAGKSQLGATSNMTLVRDDCGQGRHFSERQNKCVDNDEDRDGDRGGRVHKSRKERCRDRCQDIRAECNARRGGYFNGCGVQATSCMASC
jgi:hypothetical protein